jgi:hypothetical protein
MKNSVKILTVLIFFFYYVCQNTEFLVEKTQIPREKIHTGISEKSRNENQYTTSNIICFETASRLSMNELLYIVAIHKGGNKLDSGTGIQTRSFFLYGKCKTHVFSHIKTH